MCLLNTLSSILLVLRASEASSYMVEPISIWTLKMPDYCFSSSLSARAWHDVGSENNIHQSELFFLLISCGNYGNCIRFPETAEAAVLLADSTDSAGG